MIQLCSCWVQSRERSCLPAVVVSCGHHRPHRPRVPRCSFLDTRLFQGVCTSGGVCCCVPRYAQVYTRIHVHTHMGTRMQSRVPLCCNKELQPLCQKSRIKEFLLQLPTMPSAALSHSQTSVLYGVPSLGPLGFCFGHLSLSVPSMGLSEIFQTFSNKVEPKTNKDEISDPAFPGGLFLWTMVVKD